MINFVDYYIHYTERLRHINNAVLNAPAELIRQMEERIEQAKAELKELEAQIRQAEEGEA